MGILDEAIREHLDLKRRLGTDPDSVKRLEDEAFGPPGPGEPDFPESQEQPAAPAADAAPAVDKAAQPEGPTGETKAPAETPDLEGPTEFMPPADKAEVKAEPEATPAAASPEAAAPAGAPAPAEEETKPEAGEPEADATDEGAEEDLGPPTASHEPDLSVVDQPTMVFDSTAEDVGQDTVEHPAPEPPSEPSEPIAEELTAPFDIESLDLDLDDVEAEPEVGVIPDDPAEADVTYHGRAGCSGRATGSGQARASARR